jgi:hypothetical protein
MVMRKAWQIRSIPSIGLAFLRAIALIPRVAQRK